MAVVVSPASAAPELHRLLAAQKTPAEQLAEELVRLRTKGFDFELAWKRAMRVVAWPVTKETRRQWKASLEQCKDYWGQCYRNEGVRLTMDQIIEAMDLGFDVEDPARLL